MNGTARSLSRRWMRVALGIGFLPFFFAALPPLSRAELVGPPITDNNYRLDLSRGVVMGSTEKVAMGGAGSAIDHGADALGDNPAAVAMKPAHARGGWDWDGTVGNFVLSGKDFDNNGSHSTAYKRHHLVTAGGLLRWKSWGIGVLGITQRYDVETSNAVRRFEFMESHIVLGRSVLEERLTWGVGFRIAGFKALTKETKERLLELSGSGVVAGFQYRPRTGPWRLGAAYLGSIQDDPDRVLSGSGVASVDGLILPKGVDLPATMTVGVSRLGERFLCSLDLRATGRVEEANGVESFLEGTIQRSGRRATLSPRAGGQYEARPDRLRLRAGTYFEPSRFQGVRGRWHGTAGAEARLFKLNWFGGRHVSFSYALDAASRYVAHHFSLGFWH